MRFRPCIDIHNGSVKQIVGSSLADEGGRAQDNFVSELSADYYAALYRDKGLFGGHVIILNPKGSEFYSQNLEQARLALSQFEGGLQIGGGITDENAADFISMGASHVIVTSFVFRDGCIDFERLRALVRAVGRERIVLDLSCKRQGSEYLVVTDRWQKLTSTPLCRETLLRLSEYCDEFLVHAADAEGKREGVEQNAARILAHSPLPCTYAGGIAAMEDIELIKTLGGGRVDFTVGSALDIFGGELPFEGLCEYK